MTVKKAQIKVKTGGRVSISFHSCLDCRMQLHIQSQH